MFRIITIFWDKLLKENRYRLSGSISFSLLCHIILICGYLGLVFLDQPEVEVIQEINFVDLTEIPEKPDPPNTDKRDFYSTKSPLKKESIKKFSDNNYKVKPDLPKQYVQGKDDFFLDQTRKQVPINLEKIKTINNDIKNPVEMIKISPAIGIKNNERIARPAEIDLNGAKKFLSVSNSNSEGAISLRPNTSSEINLTQDRLVFKKEESGTKFDLKKKIQSEKISDIQIPDTQTLISGPLAGRRIEKKTIPSFPSWAKKRGFGAEIALRFTVMEDGTVKENVIVEKTSGSGEWDKLVIKALKTWKFVSLERINTRKDQTGVITFRFVI